MMELEVGVFLGDEVESCEGVVFGQEGVAGIAEGVFKFGLSLEDGGVVDADVRVSGDGNCVTLVVGICHCKGEKGAVSFSA